MHAINNMIKWSLVTSAVLALLVVGGLFAIWFTLEVLVFLVNISA